MINIKKYSFIVGILLLLISCNSQKAVVSNTPVKVLLNEEEQTRFSTFFYEGIRQKEERLFDQALETFRICEQIDSTDGGLQSELGQLYSAIGKTDMALIATKKAYESNPSNWWYNLNLISLYAALKQNEKALDIALNLEKYYPEKEETFQIQSSLFKEVKQFAKAIESLDKLEQIAGVDGAISMDKFNLYLQLRQNKKAIAEIDKLSAKFPSDMRYKVLRGDIYMYQKMPDKAYEIYKQVEANEPENPYVYVSLSEYYKDKGDNENSMQNMMKALKLDALEVEQKITILGDYIKDLVRDTVKLDETESLFKLLIDRYPLEEKVYDYYAVFLQFRKRNTEALANYETMLNINPKNEQTWMQLIQLRLQEQNFEELQKASDRAIATLPEIHQYYFYKGIAETQLKNYLIALDANNKALSLVKEEEKPVKGDYYAQIGDIFYKMDSTERAFEAYEKALEANPANIYVMNNYAYYLSEKNMNLKKAESLSAKTIEKEPKNSTYLDTYAWIFYQQGNYSLAKFYMERAIDNMDKKQDPGVMYEHYGDILLKTGNEKKALEMWKKSYETEHKTDALKLKIENLTELLKKNEK
jgi:tetratricopeptide (TPR) repeat protein